MEAMVKNLSSSVELLAVATHSDSVGQWDKTTLSRAFHWALYCEHICGRFQNKPAIRMALERQLELTNESLRVVFPEYTAICFSDLSRSQHLLLDGLLHNTETPISIIKMLFDNPIPLNKDQNSYQDIAGRCSAIIECRSAYKVLGTVTTSLSFGGADAEVQAELLLEKLGDLLKQSNGVHNAKEFLDSALHGSEKTGQHFCLIITLALLTKTNSQTSFILDWLELKHSHLEYMCRSLPTSLLKDVSKKNVRYRDMYINVLKKWASEMEYNISNSEWTEVSRNPVVSFQKLTEHFVSLIKASVSLKDHVETELKALKFSDGDFDVRGLSIWGDLLSEIHKCQN